MLSPIIVLLVLSCCSLGYALPTLAPATMTRRIAPAPSPSHDMEVIVNYGPGRKFRWDRKAQMLVPQKLPLPPTPMKVPYLQEFTRDPTPVEKELVDEIIRELPIGFDYEIHPGEHWEIRRMHKGNWEPRGICGRIRVFAVHDGYRALVKDTGCCNCESGCDCVINARPCCNCAEGWTWAAIACCISVLTGKSAFELV
ncbi:hypothetical protein PCANC_26923 [Puccinia coronata f. sp. avenae]|uniref:Uncharacterized protein n=2 Tax=Puccinia coronata f. sp. avenae TaxID=200324 RepID=A0A2N5TQQ3_9BASI|nr:hypothetical protein PCANC_26923 [Puccinia coronata f. sp. avenae]